MSSDSLDSEEQPYKKRRLADDSVFPVASVSSEHSFLHSDHDLDTEANSETVEIEELFADDRIVEALVRGVSVSVPSALLKHRIDAAIEPEQAVVVTDSKGFILSVSKPFSEMCGYTLNEIRGKKPGSFLQGPKTERAAVERLRQAVRTGGSCCVELWNYHKNGSPYRVRINLFPLLDTDGECIGYKAFETCLERGTLDHR
jgi:PAS domain S-box-containing protein